MFKDDESQKFLKDETVAKKFAGCKKLSEVDASEYDAIFYVGGHGPVIDLATDPENIKLANAVRSPWTAVTRCAEIYSVLEVREDNIRCLSRTCVRPL